MTAAGEKGEKVAHTGDEMGIMVDESGGDIGLCGGGVGDSALGVAWPEDVGEPKGEEFRGEYCPLYCSETPGDPAEMGLVSTSLSREDRKVDRSSLR